MMKDPVVYWVDNNTITHLFLISNNYLIVLNTYISLCGDGSEPEHLENYGLGCLNVSYNGALRPEISGTVWPRFSHTGSDTDEGQSFIFEKAMTKPKLSNCDGLVIRILDVSKLSHQSIRQQNQRRTSKRI